MCSSSSSSEELLPCFVVLDDIWRGMPDLASLFAAMQRPCFGLMPPEVSSPWGHTLAVI